MAFKTSKFVLLKTDESCPASQCGLTAWRILSGYPHYNLIEDEGTKFIKVSSSQPPTNLLN